MSTVLILALTVLALSSGAIASSWQRYGQAARGARQERRDCPQTREVRFQIVEYGTKPAAQVIALPIKRKATPAYQQPLRAAA